jgi:hypothetical protein
MRARNARTGKTFEKGDTVTLTREIKLKDKTEYPRGTKGIVIQIYQSSAVRVQFEDGREPVIAALYLH